MCGMYSGGQERYVVLLHLPGLNTGSTVESLKYCNLMWRLSYN